MSTWNQADIERLREKGMKVIDTRKPQEYTKPPQNEPFALGRMKQGEMNKTETAYANYLEKQKQFGDVENYWFEHINLRLANRCFFKVDFFVMLKDRRLECHEVKGYWTDDALVKIKTAAAMYPFRFISVKLEKGEWKTREF